MDYEGKVYGKVGGKYIELSTTNQLQEKALIQRMESELIGMQKAHKLITELENSSVDHFERECYILWERIQKLKLGVTKLDR